MGAHLLAALVALDAITTWLVLRNGGIERNPLLAAILARIGVIPGLLLTHGAVIAGVYLVAFPAWLLWALIAIVGAVVANNARVILKG